MFEIIPPSPGNVFDYKWETTRHDYILITRDQRFPRQTWLYSNDKYLTHIDTYNAPPGKPWNSYRIAVDIKEMIETINEIKIFEDCNDIT